VLYPGLKCYLDKRDGIGYPKRIPLPEYGSKNKIKIYFMLTKVQLFKTLVSTGGYQDYVQQIMRLAATRTSSYVCFANVHMLMEAYQQPGFNQVVNEADIVAPDGGPLSVLMRHHYGIDQRRACGMDMFPDILKAAQQNQVPVYFYGSTPEVLAKVTAKAQQQFPALPIAGSYSPPFRPLTPEEDQAIVNSIKASGAQLVFVSLGCPKQEKWMFEHRGRIAACMLGLGQAFLVYAGMEKRLPAWARNLSLEWLYRLYLEPKRLWKRYLKTNSMFLLLAGKSILVPTSNKVLPKGNKKTNITVANQGAIDK
jgi:N-acetylglucosaminyldiphosphoundecaprenol N-acetyl-beta-D-mannosaminyltransferase